MNASLFANFSQEVLLLLLIFVSVVGCGDNDRPLHSDRFFQDWNRVADSVDRSLHRQKLENPSYDSTSEYWALNRIKPVIENVESFALTRIMQSYVASKTDEHSLVMMIVSGCSNAHRPIPVLPPNVVVDSGLIKKQCELPEYYMTWAYRNVKDSIHIVYVNNRIDMKIQDTAVSMIAFGIHEPTSEVLSGVILSNTYSVGVCCQLISVWTAHSSAIVATDGLMGCDNLLQNDDQSAYLNRILCLVTRQEYVGLYWRNYY